MTIRRKPQVSFAISNNLLAPSTKGTDLKISPRATIAVAWNNSENPEDGSNNMKHWHILVLSGYQIFHIG
jgi:hypothetical protein